MLVVTEAKKTKNPDKNPGGKDENQHQIEVTYDAGYEIK